MAINNYFMNKLYWIFVSSLLLIACDKNIPVDEQGLLITDKDECYISSFDLYGSDSYTVLESVPTISNGGIDTVFCTINAVAKFGTNLKHVKPMCSVSLDSKLTPSMGTWMDFTEPQKFTVISGDRKVSKEYVITVTVRK